MKKSSNLNLLKYGILGSLYLIGFNLAMKVPQLHRDYIRSSVGGEVVRIWKEGMRGGGTGFHVRAPSGQVYILTNDHVCQYTKKDGMVLVQDNEEPRVVPRRIIEMSDKTDLCLIEALPNHSGLKLGSEPQIGDIVEVVGHPKLLPTVVTIGEIYQKALIQVVDHIIDPNNPNDCMKPKNKKFIGVDMFFFTVDLCVVEIEAYNSTATILPGSSGSPVIDWKGRLVAVAFAGNSETNWGSFVTFPDIQDFLSIY